MKTVLISFFFLGLTSMYQQSPNHESNEATYKAYLGNTDRNAAKEQWKKIVADSKAKSTAHGRSKDLFYELALAQFGLLSATLRDQDEELFDAYAGDAEQNLQSLIDENKNWGEPNALLSALYGLKMAYSPIKGMFLGPKSQHLMDQAMENAPSSPLVWKLYANAKFFTPETFGGDIKEAIKAYEKALKLYENRPEKIKNNWFYLDTMAFLGQAYVKNGQTERAISVYEKALKAEPEYAWVKFNLLPQAKKSAASN